MLHEDWGVVADRWAGIRSDTVEVRGTPVHVLRHDGPTDAANGRRPVPHLLVHGLGGSAANWLEVIKGLARTGPVVAPDLPGFGRTAPPQHGTARVNANAAFLAALMARLGWDRAVVHGNSMGGLLAVLLADRRPELIDRLILLDPALPAPRRRTHRIDPQTLVRFAPFAVPYLGKVAVGRIWRRTTPEQMWRDTQRYVHGDASRIAPELAQLIIDNLAYGREEPWRLEGFVDAATSLVSAIASARRLNRAVSRLPSDTLLLWGDADRLIGRDVIDALMARRPDWDLHVFPTVGHCAQIEVPNQYLEVVRAWLADAGPDEAVSDPARSAPASP